MSLKIIQKKIRWIGSTTAKVNGVIHETALLICAHTIEYNDCSTAKDLINAMPASMRRTMLKLWFETFTPIRFQMKDGLAIKVGMLKPDAKTYTPWDVVNGEAKPFYELAEENPEKGNLTFDKLLALIQAQVKRAEKSVEEGKVEEKDRDSILLVAHTLKGLNFKRVTPANDANNVELFPSDVVQSPVPAIAAAA
jgi:hypothetical protein